MGRDRKRNSDKNILQDGTFYSLLIAQVSSPAFMVFVLTQRNEHSQQKKMQLGFQGPEPLEKERESMKRKQKHQ